MEDGVGAGQRDVERGWVEQVSGAVIGRRVAPQVPDVDRAHLMSGPQQVIHHVGADETAPAGDGYPHDAAPGPVSSAPTSAIAASTSSTSPSVMSEWTGRQTCRAHMSSATGSGGPA